VPPSSGTPIADLSPRLDALLLESLGWLMVAAAAVAFAVWWFARRHSIRLPSVRVRLLGPAGSERSREPEGRRFLRVGLGLLWIVDGMLQAQPEMAGGFGRDVLTPGLASLPDWLGDAVGPLARVWTRHPVTADAATVWIQIGLGVLMILSATGALSRFAIWASVVWSVLVWVVGEALGGLFSPGAGWLVGAPGAVLVYLLGAVLLLTPWRWWESGRTQLLSRRAVGLWLLIGAALQSLPWEGFWSGTGLAAPFDDGAATVQPAVFQRPISALADATARHPTAINAALVAALVVVGVGLCLSRAGAWVVAGIVLCAATWWLAQDFGVLGGMATDPNTALPLGVLLVSALPVWLTYTPRLALPEPTADVSRAHGRWPVLPEPARAAFATLGLGSLVVAPLVVAGLLLGPADSAAVAADGGGGLVSVLHRQAPSFALTDQNGKPVSMTGLRGKLTLVTFLDPVCSDECPVIANQLAIADRELGPLAARVEIVAIDSNPVFVGVPDVAAFTSSHDLSGLPNWHFLAGSATDLQAVTAAYGIAVQVPTVGMIEHGEGIYFVGADGTTQAYLGDGAAETLTETYAAAVRDEIRRLLA
jgi:cytochrome oxidase Cu insertion factor (SCO1/SenC/PrrC family)